jgi:hypothetical protein
MQNNYFIKILSIILLLNISPFAFSQNIATYDNLTLNPNSVWYGSDNSGGFTDSGYLFENSYSDFGGGMYAWYGFAYSNKTDTITAGYTNQFSAITGVGVLNSAVYAVSYVNYDYMNAYQMHPNVLRFSTQKTISGFYVTNNTYAYLSMLNGDGTLAKKFGGTSGNDPDWFKLQIKGYRNGYMIDTVNCFLADFRFTNNTQDYILKTWKWVDLSVLGNVDSLSFGLTSSDNGAYGINTPAYFCMDNFNGINPYITVNELNNKDFNINIYPNPFAEIIHIQRNSTAKVITMNIYDVNGKEIRNLTIANQANTINLADLTSGVYFVRVSGSDFNHYQKIIKK